MTGVSGEGTAERAQAIAAEARLAREQGRWDDALELTFDAARQDGRNPAILYDLALLLTKFGRLEEGETVARNALGIVPAYETALLLAHNLMAQGRLAEAWPLHAARTLIPGLNNGYPKGLPFPHWEGESLQGKRIAIFPEQGFGDQIQLARFLPYLADRGAAVTLLARRPLVALFAANFPDFDIVTAEGQIEFPDPDLWATLYDLPAIFRVGLYDIPPAPYLTAPAASAPAPGGFRIGLRDRGNPSHRNDASRSLPEPVVARLRAELPGTVVDLDPEKTGARDFADTAAIVASLDLVVSVDTAVAHLAGALGTPCSLLISGFGPDWRWMFGRDDSPWYGNHSLYRSRLDGDWDDAVTRVIADAHARAGSR